ncbi:hypothetical protein CPC08DRAFT_769338 [Agrocybe pediades]|nr:hypothetical protein CPC08DRAFT_769338 [Agrocybe pediades]
MTCDPQDPAQRADGEDLDGTFELRWADHYAAPCEDSHYIVALHGEGITIFMHPMGSQGKGIHLRCLEWWMTYGVLTEDWDISGRNGRGEGENSLEGADDSPEADNRTTLSGDHHHRRRFQPVSGCQSQSIVAPAYPTKLPILCEQPPYPPFWLHGCDMGSALLIAVPCGRKRQKMRAF